MKDQNLKIVFSISQLKNISRKWFSYQNKPVMSHFDRNNLHINQGSGSISPTIRTIHGWGGEWFFFNLTLIETF